MESGIRVSRIQNEGRTSPSKTNSIPRSGGRPSRSMSPRARSASVRAISTRSAARPARTRGSAGAGGAAGGAGERPHEASARARRAAGEARVTRGSLRSRAVPRKTPCPDRPVRAVSGTRSGGLETGAGKSDTGGVVFSTRKEVPMSRRIPMFALVLVAVLAALALAWPRGPAALAASPSDEPFYPQRFAVAVSPSGTILLDTATGSSFRLVEPSGKPPVWERVQFVDRGFQLPYPPSASLTAYPALRELLGRIYEEQEKNPGAPRP